MSTPLDRAANVLLGELQDYIPGFDNEDWIRFSYKLASDVLGHARLPEELDVAAEMRTANLLTLATMTPGVAEREELLAEVDKRMGRG